MVIFGELWWHLTIFRDKTMSSIMICHDISWFVMISHQPIQRGSVAWIWTKNTCWLEESFLECNHLAYMLSKKSSICYQCLAATILLSCEFLSSLNFFYRHTESDAYKPDVHICTGGLKKCLPCAPWCIICFGGAQIATMQLGCPQDSPVPLWWCTM